MPDQFKVMLWTLFKHCTALAPACVLASCLENLNEGGKVILLLQASGLKSRIQAVSGHKATV